MTATAKLDLIGDALAHPSRARMLCALMDGRAFTAKELAAAAVVSPQTASPHLARLLHAGLIETTRSGRCTYHLLSGEPVARALETLSTLVPAPPQVRADPALRLARSCFNHLAGRLATAIAAALQSQGLLREEDGRFAAAATSPGRWAPPC